MPIPSGLGRLRLPAIAAPLFLISDPDLVVATCNAGVTGTFPSLNQRSAEGLSDWLSEIESRLAPDAAPHGVNLIMHRSNPRLEADLAVVVRHRVPLVITSLGAAREVVDAVHSYGGLVFHDVISRRHAEKAAEAGVDGIVCVAAGAGGHTGLMSPFALLAEIREIFDGCLILSGAITTGAHIAAARLMGADLAYLGTRFIASHEAHAQPAYKQMLVDSRMADILHTDRISGVPANFLVPSIVRAGLDPENLPAHQKLDVTAEARAWRDVWSAGHGVGGIRGIQPVAEICAQLMREYAAAMARAESDPFRP